MSHRHAPINPMCKNMLHGGDYNPDQWIRTPEIWDEDMRLMKLAGCNAASTGIFAWAALEPEEGKFTFDWLDTIMDKLAANKGYAVLATPSGSKPAWMSRAYPEVCRVNADGTRQPHERRHNHCRTSPVYREKCQIINAKLAERYKNHPALLLWHISNEYNGGDCHCDLCIEAFQNWLRKRYNNDIDALNHAYWAAFWAHTFPGFDYVRPTDRSIHCLMLDWERFKTYQTIDFYKDEIKPLRQHTPNVPITTNFMNGHDTLDYWAFAREVDFISWDSYPNWHEGNDVDEAVKTALLHDQCRTMKQGKPFLLMESVPSIPTRGRVKKRKEPGMHMLSSMQAVAHGGDGVLYFQWRKSRGCSEKFHGAVVDHEGSEHTREFKEVAEVGTALAKLDDVVGSSAQPEVALLLDWENGWAIREGARVFLGENCKYREECAAHYRPFWQMGVPVDVIDQNCDLSAYKMVVLPMAYMLRPGFADRLKGYVHAGGTAVMTYWSAIVDESDLCFLGGVPGDGLREVFGVWEEETQSYYPHETVPINPVKEIAEGLSGYYQAVDICSVVHAEGKTKILAEYGDHYFEGMPAVTVNNYGDGRAYYIAARTRGSMLSDLYGHLIKDLGLKRAIDTDLPHGVTAQVRGSAHEQHIFLMNFNAHTTDVLVGSGYVDILTGESVSKNVELEKYGVRVLRRTA